MNTLKAKAPTVVRCLLGFIFFASGVAGLFNLIQPPANMPEKMQLFMTGMMATGYLFPLIKLTEIVCGLGLLINRFVPLALVVLAPIVINIAGVHFFLDPSGMPVAIIIGLMTLYLSFFAPAYSPEIKRLFRSRAN